MEKIFVTSVEKAREYEIRKRDAKRLQLRLFTIDVGGYTPWEKHEHEQEVHILRGKVLVGGGEQETCTAWKCHIHTIKRGATV